MGGYDRPSPYYPVLQVLRVSEGEYPASSRVRKVLIRADHPSESAGRESRPQRARVQFHRRVDTSPRYADLDDFLCSGVLIATGYWIPYEAAKAILATFCYEIRFVLTPMFGNDFVNTCIPIDNPCFGSFRIDPKIVKFCAEETKQWEVPTESRSTPTRPRSLATTAASKSIKSAAQPLRVIRPRRSCPTETSFSEDDEALDKNGEHIYPLSLARAKAF